MGQIWSCTSHFHSHSIGNGSVTWLHLTSVESGSVTWLYPQEEEEETTLGKHSLPHYILSTFQIFSSKKLFVYLPGRCHV